MLDRALGEMTDKTIFDRLNSTAGIAGSISADADAAAAIAVV